MTLHLVVNVTISLSFTITIKVLIALWPLLMTKLLRDTKASTAKRRRKHTKDKRKKRKIIIHIRFK